MNDTGIKVSKTAVIRTMNEDYRLSYRRIKRVSFAGNSERNKVLRCLYAQKMLQVFS